MKKQFLKLSIYISAIFLSGVSCQKSPIPISPVSENGTNEKQMLQWRITTPGIIYTPLNIVLTANVKAYSGRWSQSVDLDKDSTTDFTFSIDIAHSRGNDFYQITTSITAPVNGGGVISNWGATVLSGAPSAWISMPLTAGTVIGPNNTTYISPSVPSTYLYSYYFGARRGGLIIGKGNKLVGMRFASGGNTYYGWLTVSVSNNGRIFTIVDGAFNNTPNAPINAGAKL